MNDLNRLVALRALAATIVNIYKAHSSNQEEFKSRVKAVITTAVAQKIIDSKPETLQELIKMVEREVKSPWFCL